MAQALHGVILAGGAGRRLWPISQENTPKQLLALGGSHSLLQATLLRCQDILDFSRLTVVTHADFRADIEAQIQAVALRTPVTILCEPTARNTGPAVALAVRSLELNGHATPKDVVVVFPSDHWMSASPQTLTPRFEQAVAATQHGPMVLFGVLPTYPETAYGYIQVAPATTSWPEGPMPVTRFVEKPSTRSAKRYLTKDNYYWNVGIVAFEIGRFWRHLAETAPAMATMQRCKKTSGLFRRFRSLPAQSLDCAVLEKSRGLGMIPLPILWTDMGSWDSLYHALLHDDWGNALLGESAAEASHTLMNTQNCLLYQAGKRAIVAIDLADLIIVDTPDALLLVRRNSSQKLRDLLHRRPPQTP